MMKAALLALATTWPLSTAPTAPALWLQTHNAICNHPSHGYHGWFGPARATLSEAYRDARTHERANPGHVADAL